MKGFAPPIVSIYEGFYVVVIASAGSPDGGWAGQSFHSTTLRSGFGLGVYFDGWHGPRQPTSSG